MDSRPLLDDFFDYFGEREVEKCGMPHPRLEGNHCVLDMDHRGKTHIDAAGNEWMGQPFYDQD
jgi:hypothetical protein